MCNNMPKKANPHGMLCIWGALGRPRADPLDVFNGFFKNSIFRFKQIAKKSTEKMAPILPHTVGIGEKQ